MQPKRKPLNPRAFMEEHHQELFEMHVLKGMSAREIAKHFNLYYYEVRSYLTDTQIIKQLPYDFVDWTSSFPMFLNHQLGDDYSIGLCRRYNNEATFVVKASVLKELLLIVGEDTIKEAINNAKKNVSGVEP